MANVRSDLVFYLKEKKIERGYKCDQTPSGNYFEKKGSKWVDLEVKTIGEVYKKKGWKIPSTTKSVTKKAVKKNAKPKKEVVQQETEQPSV